MTKASKALSREAILAAATLPSEAVPVPEWGGEVFVQGLTGRQRDAFESPMAEARMGTLSPAEAMVNLRARLVSMCAIDENGDHLFGPDDVEALGNLSAAALNRVFEAARRLSGLGEEDVADLAENLDSGQNGGSTSA